MTWHEEVFIRNDFFDKTPEQPKKKGFGAFTEVEGNQAQIDLNILRQHNVFFATPCYGGQVTDQFFLSMFRLSQTFMQHGINFRITTLRNESLVTRARNILTAMFLESDCSHLCLSMRILNLIQSLYLERYLR